MAALLAIGIMLIAWPAPYAAAAVPTLTVTPNSAASGNSLTVTGSGWDANATVDVMWSASVTVPGPSTEPILGEIDAVQANSQGQINTTIPALVPSSAMNPYFFTCPTSVSSEEVYGMESSLTNPNPPQSQAENITITPWLAVVDGTGTSVGFGFNSSGEGQYGVSAGSSVTLGGCFFTPNATYNVTWPGGVSVASGTTDSNGAFATTVNIPSNATLGSNSVTVRDGTFTASVPTVTDDASLTLSATSVSPGNNFTVTGSGFTPSSSVSLVAFGFGSTTGNLAGAPTNVTADASGNFAATWTVPSSQASGTFYVEVIASDGVLAGTSSTTASTVSGTATTLGDSLAFASAPTSATENTPFDASIDVDLPSSGGIDTNATDTIKLSLIVPNGQAGALTGTTSVQAVNGVATFNNISVVGGYGSNYEIQATDTTNGAVTSVTSGAFSVTKPIDTLNIAGVPTDVTAGQMFQFTVSLEAGEFLDSAATDTLNLTADAPSGQAVSLTGTTTEQTVNGVATFNVAFPGSSTSAAGYSLTVSDATDASVTNAAVNAIAIVNPAQDTLSFDAQPPSNITDGQTFSVTVSAYSPVTNAVDTANDDTIALALAAPAGFPAQLLGTTGASLQSGQATFQVYLSGGNGPGYTLTATDTTHSGVPVASSSSFSLPFTPVATSSQVTYLAQPSGAYGETQTLTATVQAAVYDQEGNLLSTQEIGYELMDNGSLVNMACADGTTDDICTEPITNGQATIGVDLSKTDVSGSSMQLLVAGYSSPGGLIGTPTASDTFTVMAPEPLFVALGSTAFPKSNGAWGAPLPSYSSPAASPSSTSSSFFAGVQFFLNYTAGDHIVLAGDAPGTDFCVDGTWQLNITDASTNTVVQTLSGNGCTSPVDLASLSLPTGTYEGQILLSTEVGSRTFGTGDIVWYQFGQPVPFNFTGVNSLPSGYNPLTLQIQQGSPAVIGNGAYDVPIVVASSPMPVTGIHAEASWDPTAMGITIEPPSTGVADYGNRVPGHWGFMVFPMASQAALDDETGAPLTVPDSGAAAGQTAIDLGVTCLESGSFPVTMDGSWWYTNGQGNSISQPFSFTGTIDCAAPAAVAATAVEGVQVNPQDGSVSISVVGVSLGQVKSADLVDPTTNVPVVDTSNVSIDTSGSQATVTFASAPGGDFTLRLLDVNGNVVTENVSTLVPPALPFFTLNEADQLPQQPGYNTTHFWHLTNAGDVNGYAVVAFVFPSFLQNEPSLDTTDLPTGSYLLEEDQSMSNPAPSWAAIVSVPLDAGQSTDIAWTINLLPSAVGGTTGVLQPGDTMPLEATRLGAVTDAQAQTLGITSGPTAGFGAALAQQSNQNLSQALSAILRLDNDTTPSIQAEAAAYQVMMRTNYAALATQMFDQGLLNQFEAMTIAQENNIVR
jgi:hypothetical protein